MVEMTSRTIGGRFLLRPGPRLNERVIGVLARAQQYAGVEIYGVNVQSSHPHLDVGVQDSEQLAAFACYAQSNIAKEVNRLHGWSDKLWARRYPRSSSATRRKRRSRGCATCSKTGAKKISS